MQIDGFGNIKATTAKKRSAGVGAAQSGAFSELIGAHLADEAQENTSINEVAPANSLSGLFALQEISDNDVNRKKLAKRGEEMLDCLDDLRRGLLLGTVNVQVLQDINQKISAKREEFNDPKLIAILDDIELRAAVELAKLEMAMKQGQPIQPE